MPAVETIVYTNEPGRILPILEKELEDFDTEAGRYLNGEWIENQFIGFRLKQGVYGQRQPGVQMIRCKLPLGGVTPDQMDAFAEVADRLAPLRKAHITTRQNFQIHHMPIMKAAEVACTACIFTRTMPGDSGIAGHKLIWKFPPATTPAIKSGNLFANTPVLLNNETESWAAVGSALYDIGDLDEAVEWMSDWHVRPDVAPWMLWNLSLALRDLNREEEAKEVGLHAISLPEDHRTSSHLALLSLDEALAGHIADATHHVERIAPHSMHDWEQLLVTLSTNLSQFHQARAEGRTSGPAIIDELLKVAHQAPWLKKSRPLATLFKRAIDTILTNENDAMLKIKTKLKMKWFAYRA